MRKSFERGQRGRRTGPPGLVEATDSGRYPAVANHLLPLPGCFSGQPLDVATLLLLKLHVTYVILHVRAKCSSHGGLGFSN